MDLRSSTHVLNDWNAARDQLYEMERSLGFAILRHIKEAGPYPMGMADEVAAKRREVEMLARAASSPEEREGF